MRYRSADIEKMLSFGVYPDTTLKRARERRDTHGPAGTAAALDNREAFRLDSGPRIFNLPTPSPAEPAPIV